MKSPAAILGRLPLSAPARFCFASALAPILGAALLPFRGLGLALRVGVVSCTLVLPTIAEGPSAYFDNLSVETGEAPVISSQPISVNVEAGSVANFGVSATGTGPLSYQWRLHGTNLPGANQPALAVNPGLTGGSYSVVVSNLFGSVTSAVAILGVKPEAPRTLTSLLGSNTVTFSWSAVSNAVTYRLSGSNTAAASTNLPGLTITSRVVTNLPAGTWTFRAFSSNSAGESPTFRTNTFTYYTSVPTAPASFGVTFSNTNTARFTWATVTGASSYRLWATNFTTKTSFELRGLTTNTLATNLAVGDWFFVSAASNNVGRGPDSITLRFSLQSSIPAAPATFGVTFSNTNQARFTWSAVSNATSYRLWGTNYTAKTSLSVPNLNSTSLATNLTFGDWWFSVYPTNNAGSGAGAVALRFMVHGSVPTAPASFGVTLSNTNQARFTWSTVSNATSYRLWGTNYTAKTSLNVANLTSTSLNTNLSLGDWWFTVIASNINGSSSNSQPARFLLKTP